jgi:hypothetical protein
MTMSETKMKKNCRCVMPFLYHGVRSGTSFLFFVSHFAIHTNDQE